MFENKVFEYGDYKLNYAVDYPENFDESKKYPVIIYLHGMGMVMKGVDFVAENCPVRRERIPDGMDFIIIAPSCDDLMWIENFKNVVRFVEYIENMPYVDEKRCSLTGSSMGGYTAWYLLILHCDLFANAVLCCSAGMYCWVGKTVNIPVICVHGDSDTVVFPRESEILAEKLNACGGAAKLIIKKGYGHDVWTDTFTDPEIYKWMFTKKRQ